MKEDTTMRSSSSSSWLGRRQAMKIVVCMAMVLLLISLYQSCTPCDSTGLSFSILGSRPFILLAPELPLDAQGEQRSSASFQEGTPSPSPSSTIELIASSNTSASGSSETGKRIQRTNSEHGAPATAPATTDEELEDELGGEDDGDENNQESDSTQVSDGSNPTETNDEDLETQTGSTPPPIQLVDNNSPLNSEVGWRKAHPNSSKLELDLLGAKLAIEGATTEDADESLYGLLYNNVSAFSMSYKLMDELFRVHVYQYGNSSLVRTGPLTGIYASEGQFIRKMIGSRFDEADPERAHMFFLPYSVAEMVLSLYVPGSRDMSPLNHFISDYVNYLARNYPFWNRSLGADHFYVSCHDWGPATARDHEQLRTNAVKVVCNANISEEFVMGKDASLPEIYLHNLKPAKVGGPAPSRRATLAFFAGQMHGHVRPVLIQHWRDKDPRLKIYEQLPPRNMSGQMSYIQHMKNSKYCICPAGWEVNSPRIVEAIYYDCVPVIIADNFVLPFNDVLNWSSFSVTIPENEIPNLKDILLSIPDKHYKSMQRRLSRIRQHFLWHDEPVKYDAFHMILHSVWMSRLNHIRL